MIYLDHAATTPIDSEVIKEITRLMQEHFANPSSLHKDGMAAQRYIQACRKEIATLLGVDTNEIFFTSGGTEANNWAIKGVLLDAPLSDGLAISAIEHSSVVETANYLHQLGHPLIILPVDKEGFVTVSALDKTLDKSIKLVSIIGGNNEIGTVQHLAELADIVHSRGALFHVDAVQLIGQVPFSIRDSKADLVSFTAHKLYGPKGIGALYIRKGVQINNLMHGGGQELGHRAGTETTFLIGGFAMALRLAIQRLDSYSTHCRKLSSYTYEKLLTAFPNLKLNGPQIGPNRLPANINISLPKFDGHELVFLLQNEGFALSTGSACHADQIIASHVIQAITVPTDYQLGTLRVTVGHSTSKSDIDAFVATLQSLLS